MKIRQVTIVSTGFHVHWFCGAYLFIKAVNMAQSRQFACTYLANSFI